ncbi:MAG: hypothetical protein D3M94_01410 [Rhodocyclales bacterium GT-UBC]|nr:MAG: hypothetical protein D3M94_01410 [Rhodocyclales bacterium GT-UBC]
MNSAAVLLVDNTPLPTINFEMEHESAPAAASAARAGATIAGDTSAALESMPHLARQIVQLWRTRELNTLIHKVLLDSRDGSRQGFPIDVARELMFLAKMNVILRAQDAAPLLGISIGEACRLIEKGDHAALGEGISVSDVWGFSPRPKLASLIRGHINAHGDKRPPHPAPLIPAPRLSAVLNETPPTPSSVCLDLTASRTLRDSKGGALRDAGDVMDQGFFRCIVRELGNLKIGQLVLSDLGPIRRCAWLPSAISFAKSRCHFPKVVLHADPLSANEELLVMAMASGLDQLVLDYNLASGKWRAEAESRATVEPDCFAAQIRRLLDSRDELTRKTGHHCAISVVQINHKSVFHLTQAFMRISNEPGLTPFHHISESRRDEYAGKCHCWSPFIEAHIRTNGHLVACAQDHSGYSFAADLKQITFTDAWNGQVFRTTRQRVLHGDKPGRLCEICPHRAKTPDSD